MDATDFTEMPPSGDEHPLDQDRLNVYFGLEPEVHEYGADIHVVLEATSEEHAARRICELLHGCQVRYAEYGEPSLVTGWNSWAHDGPNGEMRVHYGSPSPLIVMRPYIVDDGGGI